MVRHRQDEHTGLLHRIDERMWEFSEEVFSDARPNLLGRFWKLQNKVFGSADLFKETSPEPFGSLFEVADLI